jgi:hypothetical protein
MAACLDKIAQIQQLTEVTVHFLAHFLATEKQLDAAGLILDVGKYGFSHVTPADKTARHGDVHLRRIFSPGRGCLCLRKSGDSLVYRVCTLNAPGIRFYTGRFQAFELRQALLF